MPLQKYLELDSTFRNRNLDPAPGQFTVSMSQSGIRPQSSALDPVTNAYPEIIFSPTKYTCNLDLPVFKKNTYFGVFSLLLPPSTPNTLYLEYTVTANNPSLPTDPNFFVGLNVVHYQTNSVDVPNFPYKRISEWECVQSDSTTQIFKAFIDTTFSTIVGDYTPTYTTETFVIPIPSGSSILPIYFLPSSLGIPNYYNKFLIENQTQTFSTNPPVLQYAKVIDFDRDSHCACIGPIIGGSSWTKSDTYIVRKELPIISSTLSAGNSINLISVYVGTAFFNTIQKENVINAFINMVSLHGVQNVNCVRKIIGVTPTTPTSSSEDYWPMDTATPDTLLLSDALPDVAQNGDKYEILQFSHDNYSPFVYNGTMSSNSQPVAYEISLNSLTLPNRYLTSGGRIAYYPYVYVTLENVSTTSGNAKNLIFSNNPNTYRATFKVPITDLNHPAITPFVKLTANGMKQTIIFKQNDDMFIKIQLPNGELFQTQELDTSNGCFPSPVLQISAVFGMERIQ
jgi:hypothetical protein